MRGAGVRHRTRGRFGSAWLLLGLLLGVQGCGDAARRADIYRVQQGLWSGYRAEKAVQLTETIPDSTALLSLRQKFLDAIEGAYPALRAHPAGQPRSAAERRLLQVVAQGEIEAARFAHNAGRPELALDRCRALAQLAEGDTSVTRRLDILIAGSLRRMGRHEESVDAMKSMLLRYPPRPPDSTGVEDFILNLPQMIVDLRKEQGDETGVRRELEGATKYFEGLLQRGGMAPNLEAQVRSRHVHMLLELKEMPRAMAGLDSLESLVTRESGMSRMIPDVRYTRLKVRSMSERDHAETIEGLSRLAFDFPLSSASPAALFDAGVLMERSNRMEDARQTYEAVATRYPRSIELASTSLLRQALLEDRAGRWEKSKSLLESIPTKYPQSGAAAQAPISVAEHYMRVKDQAGVQTALRKAAETYERMILTDSTSAGAARLRWNLFRCYNQLKDSKKAMQAVDGLVDHHPKSPFAEAALLQGANLAEANNLKPAALKYLGRFLRDYPNSPQVEAVRARIRRLTQ